MDNRNRHRKRLLAFILSAAMIITYMPVSMMTAYAAAGDVPAHSKTLTNNGDGTYKLAESCMKGNVPTENITVPFTSITRENIAQFRK